MKTKESLSILLLLTLAISIPLVVIAVQRQIMELRKKAMVEAGPAALMLLPESGTYTPEEEFDVEVRLNTGTVEEGGGSVYMFTAVLDFSADQDKIEAVETAEGFAVSLPDETPFTQKYENSVSGGIIRYKYSLDLFSGDPTPFTGTMTIGTVRLRVKDDASETASVQFTDESSVMQRGEGDYDPGVDILGTVHGGTYTIQSPDATAPETEITGGPSEGEAITTDEATLTFTGSDAVTATEDLVYSWKVEKEETTVTDWTSFSSETESEILVLSTGNYTFKVKAKDEAGNEDASPATRNFSVDLGECTPGEMQDCIAANTCDGTQTCEDDSTWGDCVTEYNHCDEDCDGTPDTCKIGDCRECPCTTGETRDCTTEDSFKGTQECAAGIWGTCEKITPHECASEYELCDDDICLTDCGDCVPEATDDCVTADHFKGTKTCTSERAWGECIKGTECEDGYEKCPDGTCQISCPEITATLDLTFKLEGRAHAKKDPIKIFAREPGSDASFGQAPWKQNINVETDSEGKGSVSDLSLEGLDTGNKYEFLLKGPQHLQKKETIDSLGSGENSLDFGRLLAGDITGDGTVNIMDIDFWANELWKEDSNADINGDGTVNIVDLSILAENLLKEGER